MKGDASRQVLVVDDDDAFRERLALSLRRRGHEVATAADGREVQALLATFQPGFAVIDLRLGTESGLEIARELRARLPQIRILMLTGYGSIATAVDAMRLGAVDYLSKPADASQIEAALFGESPRGEAAEEASSSVPSLDRVEWEHLQRVLVDCGGNVSEAARRLGIERRTLQRKLQKFPPQK